MERNEAIKILKNAIIESEKIIEELKQVKEIAERKKRVGGYYSHIENCEKEIEACKVAIEALDGNKWIPCDLKNIPDKEVLCCNEHGEELIGHLGNIEYGWVCESKGCIMYDVVAWMEKPEPYKPKAEKGE